MSRSPLDATVLIRGTLLGGAMLLAHLGGQITETAPIPREFLAVCGGLLLIGLLVPRGRLAHGALPLLFLGADLLAVGTLGTLLSAQVSQRLPFLSGYIVGTLVAVVGRRVGASVLGILAGATSVLSLVVYATDVGEYRASLRVTR